MKKLTLLLTSCVMAASMVSAAMAECDLSKRERKQHDPEARLAKMTEALSLSDDQRTQIQAIITNSHQQAKTLREQHEPEREKMRAQIKQIREQTKAELADVLTDEQMQKFETMKPKRCKHKRGEPSQPEQ